MATKTKNKIKDFSAAWTAKINEARDAVVTFKKGCTITNLFPRHGETVIVNYEVRPLDKVVVKPAVKPAAVKQANKAVAQADTRTTLERLRALTPAQKKTLLNKLQTTDYAAYNRAYSLLSYGEEPIDFLLKKAETAARKAHEGETRRDGYTPYITHVQAVVNGCYGNTDKVVAWLHDVVEHKKVSLEFLRQHFPSNICNSVDAISRRDNESYNAYIQRCKKDVSAKNVKVSDLNHNMLTTPVNSDKYEKYAFAKTVLNSIY